MQRLHEVAAALRAQEFGAEDAGDAFDAQVVADAHETSRHVFLARLLGAGQPLVFARSFVAQLEALDPSAPVAFWPLYEADTVGHMQELEAAAGADVTVSTSETPAAVMCDPMESLLPEEVARTAGGLAARSSAPFGVGAVTLCGLEPEAAGAWAARFIGGFDVAGLEGVLVEADSLEQLVAAGRAMAYAVADAANASPTDSADIPAAAAAAAPATTGPLALIGAFPLEVWQASQDQGAAVAHALAAAGFSAGGVIVELPDAHAPGAQAAQAAWIATTLHAEGLGTYVQAPCPTQSAAAAWFDAGFQSLRPANGASFDETLKAAAAAMSVSR